MLSCTDGTYDATELSGADVKGLCTAVALSEELSDQSSAALLLDLRAKVDLLPSLESLQAVHGARVMQGSDCYDSCVVQSSGNI